MPSIHAFTPFWPPGAPVPPVVWPAGATGGTGAAGAAGAAGGTGSGGKRPSSIRRAWISGFSAQIPKQQQKFSPRTLHHFLRAIRSSQYRIYLNIEVIIRGGRVSLYARSKSS
ncbi:hypothetical protein BDV41DRAFT_523776 [Aspergillus transmontanensis]|uniref:Uncharacterized protein n=1 Tax=Aspergillus transmontanensis TaxID=1034304 RepID=A0A5N6WCL7_9EURO|nr:hypothetical protein BDV41DRAFT_523776 [Aspergillus transmontanensis]